MKVVGWRGRLRCGWRGGGGGAGGGGSTHVQPLGACHITFQRAQQLRHLDAAAATATATAVGSASTTVRERRRPPPLPLPVARPSTCGCTPASTPASTPRRVGVGGYSYPLDEIVDHSAQGASSLRLAIPADDATADERRNLGGGGGEGAGKEWGGEGLGVWARVRSERAPARLGLDETRLRVC